MKPDPRTALEERLLRTMARTSMAWGLLEPGDRILVAVSGGKDSYSLLHLLHRLKGRLPFAIELLAIHVVQGQPGVDAAPLEKWLADSGVPHLIVREDVYSVMQRNAVDGQNPCAICARMRRGILYTQAQKNGCNKIALGHHREDTLATLLMNLFHSGRIQAMPAKYRTDDNRFDVIRPLIEVAEADLAACARMNGFPIIPCVLCAGSGDHQRRRMNELMDRLEQEHPRIKDSMLGALKNVKPSHLLDRHLRRTDV